MKAQDLIRVIAVGAVFFTAGAVAEESAPEPAQRQTLKKEDVPEAVLQAFQKEHKQLKGVEYEQETRDGDQFYGMEFKTRGKEEEMIYKADGTLIERHEEIGLKSVPTAVRDAVKRNHPKATISEAEKVINADKRLIGYEVDIREGKKATELVFDPSGKLIRQETI
jgi:hypothetical protein